jgi:Zn-dependent protease with chaperone function
MNAPTYFEWASWVGNFAMIGLMITGLAKIMTLRVRSALAQQSIWRGAFLLILFISVGESVGTFNGLVAWSKPVEQVDRTWEVSTSFDRTVASPGQVEPVFSADTKSGLIESSAWSERRSWLPGIVFLSGLVVGVVYCVLLRLCLVYYVSRHRVPVGSEILEIFDRAMQRLGYSGSCRVWVSSGTLGPFAFGLFRPTVMVPVQMMDAFSREESELVFAHEIAHLRNQDTFWHPLINLVTLIFWWHPAVWWGRWHLLHAGEFAADARVVNAALNPVSLAECLIKFGHRVWARNRMSILFQNGAAFHSALGKRIERLLKRPVPDEDQRIARRFGISSGSVVLIASCYFAASRMVFPGLAEANSIGETILAAAEPADEIQETTGSSPNLVRLPMIETQNILSINGVDESSQGSSSEESPSVKEAIRNDAIEGSSTGPLAIVELSEKDPDGPKPKFLTRRYQLVSQRSISVLQELLGIDSEEFNEQSNLQLMFRRLFRSAGVSVPMEESKFGDQSKAAIYFNQGTGMLYVRVLEKEIDTLQEMVALLNEPPSQVVISVELVEIPIMVLSRLIEDYPSLTDRESNPDDLHAILGEDEFKRLRETFLTREVGLDVLSAPKITTLSGRPAQLSMTERQSIVFSPDHEQGKGLPLFPENEAASSNFSIDEMPYETRSVAIGPSIRILPRVEPGGSEIDMDVQFTLREFVGYDDPGPFMAVIDGEKKKTSRQIPLPRFRERETKASMRLQDGQVVMLRGMTSTNIRKKKDKVPVLGDIPLLGRLFRRETIEKEEKQLLIFVKAFQIDPAGNRLFPSSESK